MIIAAVGKKRRWHIHAGFLKGIIIDDTHDSYNLIDNTGKLGAKMVLTGIYSRTGYILGRMFVGEIMGEGIDKIIDKVIDILDVPRHYRK